ncbi:MAG: AtpZ/AtpI family protein [Acidobacteria bacterium]|nr:AtpZ/AtpI family protein [Acidobacteriota bacterium]
MAEKRDNVMALVGKYSSLAMAPPSAAFAGYVIGYLLDKAFHTGFLAIVFLILGVAGGTLEVVRTLLKDTKDS